MPVNALDYGVAGLHRVAQLGVGKLLTAIVGSSTTFRVDFQTSPTWPADFFAVRIEDEVFVVSSRTGDTCTIDNPAVRAIAGTAKVDHAAGEEVRVVLDTESMTKLMNQVVDITNALLPGGSELDAADDEVINGRWAFDGGLSRPVDTVATATTLAETHHTLLANAAGGAFTITAPAPGTLTELSFIVRKHDASANAVTVDLNGTLKFLTVEGDTLGFASTGSAWVVL